MSTRQQTAPSQALPHRFNTLGINVALGGFDPVSYFPEGGGQPRKGFIKRDVEYGGVTYRFASDTNRELFRANPEKYVPAYNGWCAWAIAELNAKVDVDPTVYAIHDGRLYLFYDHADLNTRELWLANPQGMVTRANSNWQTQAH
jgi:hypothetical protein